MRKLWIVFLAIMALFCFTFAACGNDDSGGGQEEQKFFTVTVVVDNAGYGTVDKTTVKDVTENTAIAVNGNVLTIGETKVTATPTQASAQYTYSFDKFEYAGATVTGDITVTAKFTRTINEYTITFEMGDGAAIEPIKRAYGTSASELSGIIVAPPIGFYFVKWQIKTGEDSYEDLLDTDILTDNITIKAVYDLSTLIVNIAVDGVEYGVVSADRVTDVGYGTFISVNGNELIIGEAVVIAIPNESDAQYTYAFAGFENVGTTVTDNTTITAKFIRTINEYRVTFKLNGIAVDYQNVKYGQKAAKPDVEAGYDYEWKLGGNDFSFDTLITEDIVLTNGAKTLKSVEIGGRFFDYKAGDAEKPNNGYGTLSFGVELNGKTAIVYAQRNTLRTGSLLSCYFTYNITPEDVQAWIDAGYKQITTNVCFTSENWDNVPVSQFNRSNASSPKTCYTDMWYPIYFNLNDFKNVVEKSMGEDANYSLFAIEKPNADGEFGVALTEFTLSDQVRVALTPDSRFNNKLFEYNVDVEGRDGVLKTAYAFASTEQNAYAGYVVSAMHFDISDEEIQALLDEGYTYLKIDLFTSHEEVVIFSQDAEKKETFGNDIIYGSRWNKNTILFSLEKLLGYGSGRLIDLKYTSVGEYNVGMSEIFAVKEYTITFEDDNESVIEIKKAVEGNSVVIPTELPTRMGLSIRYWTLNGEPYDLSAPVTSDITLVAVWGSKLIQPTGSAYSMTVGQEVGGKTAAYTFSKVFAKGQAIDASFTNYGITIDEVDYLISEGYTAIKTSIYLTGPDDTVKIRWMLDGNSSGVTNGQRYPVNTWIPIVIDLAAFKTKVLTQAQNDTFFFQIREGATAGTFNISFLDMEVCKTVDAADSLSVMRDTQKVKYNGVYQSAVYNEEYQGKDCQVIYTYDGEGYKSFYVPLFLATDRNFATTLKNEGYNYIEIEYYLDVESCLPSNSRIIADENYSLTIEGGEWSTITISIDKFIDYYVEDYMLLVHSSKISAPGTFAISSVKAVAIN